MTVEAESPVMDDRGRRNPTESSVAPNTLGRAWRGRKRSRRCWRRSWTGRTRGAPSIGSYATKGRPGGWPRGLRARRPVEATLADDQGQTVGWELSAPGGASGEHTEAERWRMQAGHTDGAGPPHTAGSAPSAESGTGYSTTAPACTMNRRIRVRMYGGVGGEPVRIYVCAGL